MFEKNRVIFKNLLNDWSKNSDVSIKISDITKTKLNMRNKGAKTEYPYPFLKWAGGKRQLIPQMKKYFPEKFNKYIEPLVGGGAVFFYLFRNNLIHNDAILIDNNNELINCYKTIEENLDQVINLLNKYKNEKDYYYEIRKKDRNLEIYRNLTDIEKASRTIYLNKTCYNGLYRVNSKGQFNVPFGRYKKPNYCDKENLKAASVALKSVKIIESSFESCLDYAEEGDFIYLDPPYHPLTKTSSFTSYTKEDFGIDAQKKLFEVFEKLDERRCKILLTNSYSEFILNLYKEYNKVIIKAKRAINCDASKRGVIKEILILNK